MALESTFSGLEVGKKSLFAQRTALDTVGHNIANASREGYSRQRITMKADIPYTDPSLYRPSGKGQIGQGVIVSSIDRIRDELLDTRIIGQAQRVGYWETRSKYLADLENINQEPLGAGIRKDIDSFWKSWQDLSISSGDLSARYAVAEQGQNVVQAINHKFRNLKQISEIINQDVKITVDQVNQYTKNISDLNVRIVQGKAMGDNPNDLLDERDLLVDKLSQLVDITVESRRDADEFQVHVNGLHLVQGKLNFPLTVESRRGANEGLWDVKWLANGSAFEGKGGKLASLIEVRDKEVRGEIQKLNALSLSLTDMVNAIHREGYGMDASKGRNFFERQDILSNGQGAYDRAGTGEYDSTMLYRISGSHSLKGNDQIGLAGEIGLEGPEGERIQIPYSATETVSAIINKINASGAEVVARLDNFGHLEIKGTVAHNLNNYDFVIRHLEDSGEFLTRYSGILANSGAEGAYNWENPTAINQLIPERQEGGNAIYNIAIAPLIEPAGWMAVDKGILNDKSRIAAGFGTMGNSAEPGDNSTALAIASLENTNIMIDKYLNISDYFAESLAELGVKGQIAENTLNSQTAVMKDLTDMRSSISGVNMDEELSYMIQYQQSFMAASRYINTVNTLLETILGLGGRA